MPVPTFNFAAAGGDMIMDASSAGDWTLTVFESARSLLMELMSDPMSSFIIGVCIFFIVLKIVTKIGGTLVKAIIIASLVAFLLSIFPTISINLGLLGL